MSVLCKLYVLLFLAHTARGYLHPDVRHLPPAFNIECGQWNYDRNTKHGAQFHFMHGNKTLLTVTVDEDGKPKVEK